MYRIEFPTRKEKSICLYSNQTVIVKNVQCELKLSTKPQASHSVIIIDARIY